MIHPKRFDVFPLTGGSSEGLGSSRFSLKQHAVWCLNKNQNASLKTLSRQTCFKENLNASRPSEHPPVRGEMSKSLGGIIGYKYKTSSWHLNGFPDGSNIVGSTIQYRGEAHRYTVHLHLSPCRNTRQKAKIKRNNVVQHPTWCSNNILFHRLLRKRLYSTWYLNGFLHGNSNLGSTV